MSHPVKSPTALVAQFDQLSRDARMDIKALSMLLSRSRASIYRDVACGRLPRPVKFGEGPTAASRWIVGEVREYLTSQAQQRPKQLHRYRQGPKSTVLDHEKTTCPTGMSGGAE